MAGSDVSCTKENPGSKRQLSPSPANAMTDVTDIRPTDRSSSFYEIADRADMADGAEMQPFVLLVNDEHKVLTIPAQDGGFKLKDVPHTVATLGENEPFDKRPVVTTAQEIASSLTQALALESSEIFLVTTEAMPLGPQALQPDCLVVVIACRIASQEVVKFPWQWMHPHIIRDSGIGGDVLDTAAQEMLVGRISGFMDTKAPATPGCFSAWEGLLDLLSPSVKR